MTDRHHAGEDIEVPELEEVLDDVDPEAPDEAHNLLEGLLGQDASERDDVPDVSRPETDTSDSHPDDRGTPESENATPWGCRFCGVERRDTSSEPSHHAVCSDSLHQRQAGASDSSPDEAPERSPRSETGSESTASADTAGEQRTFLVDTAWHEFRAYLKYDRHALAPYYALHSLMRRTDWSHGPPTEEIEYLGTTFTVEFTYRQKKTEEKQYEPWSNPDFKIERPREFHLKVRGPGDLRKASFHIRPRWPGIQLQNGTSVNNPRSMTGVDVDAEGSNLSPGAYPELLDKAMQAFGVNGGSANARDRYLSPVNVKPWSVVIDGELYVRICEQYSGRVIGLKGPLERMMHLLADERSGYRKRVADDTEREGYYHTTTLGSTRCRRLLDNHRLAKEVKHYHVENPEALDDDDPLKQPKVGVSYQHSVSDTTVYWDRDSLEGDVRADETAIGLDAMEQELDEVLLNVLRWAGIPTRPDGQVFVADNIFTPDLNRRERRLVPDPLPAIENEQEHMVTRALNKMVDIETSDTDALVIDELLSDSGAHSPNSLAETTGKHYETILQSLKRLSDVVEHRYGEVQLKSQHVARQLAERAGSLLDDFGWLQDEVDRLGQQLARAVDGVGTDDNPFQMWAERYLEGIEDPDGDPRLFLRFGYRPEDAHELKDILRSGLSALRNTLGEHVADESRLKRFAQAEVTLRDGTHLVQTGAFESV